MNLKEIYQPIADELKTVEGLLGSSVSESEDSLVLEMTNYLLEHGGKRIRPALVILSERAASVGDKGSCDHNELFEIATAVELIHMASLIHDDVLDEAAVRHNRPTINARYGNDVSIVLGDYIYSKAFQLIRNCRNPDIFECMSEAASVMCEGELMHVCQRGNLDLSKSSYLVIAKKKTGSLFAAACLSGAIIGEHKPVIQAALKEFGLNFGVAFQIIDDCKDLLSEQRELGKHPGQDVTVRDVTLPLLALLEVVDQPEREEIKHMLGSGNDPGNLTRLRAMITDSNALFMTQEVVASFLASAKEQLDALADSVYKDSLSRLADYITQKTF